jgi:hypothetical protein
VDDIRRTDTLTSQPEYLSDHSNLFWHFNDLASVNDPVVCSPYLTIDCQPDREDFFRAEYQKLRLLLSFFGRL